MTTGEKFNKLTFIEETHRGTYYKRFGKFKCDCGQETNKLITNVRIGKTKSCGCLKIVPKIKMEIGQKLGKLTLIQFEKIINRSGKNLKMYKFKCDCGNDVIKELTRVHSGATRSCGCSRKEFYRRLTF